MDSLLQDSLNFSSKASELKFDSGDSFIQMFAYLLFVLALIFFLAFILKKTGFIQAKVPQRLSTNVVDVLGQYTITQTEKILAIKVLDTIQIVLTSQHSNQVLKEISLEDFNKLNENNEAFDKPFKSIFNAVLKKELK